MEPVHPDSLTTTLLISGMKDNRGRERIIEILRAVPGVLRVDVSLIRARATIRHTSACKPSNLIRAVTNSGHLATTPPA